MQYEIIGQGVNEKIAFKEHLIELLQDRSIIKCKVLVAFMTLNGVLQISEALQRFVSRRATTLQWIVGIDQITTADSLSLLHRIISKSNRRHTIRIFSNTERLFHPKVYIFNKMDGTGTVLVGSNNITLGGLSDNFEVSVRLDDLSQQDINRWNNLWTQISALTSSHLLDNQLLSEVEHKLRERQKVSRVRPLLSVESRVREIAPNILIRQIPLAGGRTSQVHFTRHIVETYFQCRLGQTQYLQFQEFKRGGIMGSIERRPLVYSKINRNPKLELAGAKILSTNYPRDGSRPILVSERVERDFFRYMVLLPGDDGFLEVSDYLNAISQRGLALRYSIINLEKMLDIWPDYPM